MMKKPKKMLPKYVMSPAKVQLGNFHYFISSTDFQRPDDGFSWPERMGLEEMISAISSRPLDKSKYLFELKETKGFVSYVYHIFIE